MLDSFTQSVIYISCLQKSHLFIFNLTSLLMSIKSSVVSATQIKTSEQLVIIY